MKQVLKGRFPINPTRQVDITWKDLPETEFFRIDNQQDKGEISLTLNSRFREQILAGRPKTVSDAPLVRTLLYMLLQEQVGRTRVSAKDQKYLEELNRVLRSAARVE